AHGQRLSLRHGRARLRAAGRGADDISGAARCGARRSRHGALRHARVMREILRRYLAACAGGALACALRVGSHTRAGVAGMSMRSTPSGLSASMIALITVGGAPMVPDSPMPLTPSGLVLQGTSSSSVSMLGIVSARGMP